MLIKVDCRETDLQVAFTQYLINSELKNITISSENLPLGILSYMMTREKKGCYSREKH